MRNIILLCALVLVVGITWIVISLREPKHYGADFTGAPKVAVETLLAKPSEFLGKQVTIEGTVEDQCQITGCFFYLYASTQKLKVELGDIAHTLPKRTGHLVTVEGQLARHGDSYQFLGTAAEFQ